MYTKPITQSPTGWHVDWLGSRVYHFDTFDEARSFADYWSVRIPYQLKRLERIVNIDGVRQYFWRFSDTPMIATPRTLVILANLRAKLDTDRRCSYGAREYHVIYVEYWKRESIRESLDMVNPRWSRN